MFKGENQLEKKIDHLRSEMIKTAHMTGMNSIDTIARSQELDRLIVLSMQSRKMLLNTDKVIIK